MVKHTQTIRQQQPTNCLSVFDYFVGLALKGLILETNLTTLGNQLLETEIVLPVCQTP